MTGYIIAVVCEAWGVDRPTLMGKSRRRPLPWARAMLCEYLRMYAGHDSVTCAAMLKMSPEGVVGYNHRYLYNMRTYTSFRDRDRQIRKCIKEKKGVR